MAQAPPSAHSPIEDPSAHAPEKTEASGIEVEEEEAFRLTRGWLIVGILAIFLGIASGFVMSSATFAR